MMATSSHSLQVGDDLGIVTGSVKGWSRKGYGFVNPDKGQPTDKEIFIHCSVMKAFDPKTPKDGVAPGTKITCRVEMGVKGLVASEVLKVEESSAESPELPATPLYGEVMWFEPEKTGFGFIQPEGGGKEIFCHVRAVEESGIEPHLLMQPGVKVKVTEVGLSHKKPKPEVRRLELVNTL